MLKLFFDIFPIILFFLAYNRAEKYPTASEQLANQLLGQFTSGNHVASAMAPILLATALAIVASLVQMAYLLVRRKKIDLMVWLTFGIVAVFGSLTIYFQNDIFVKLKVTIICWSSLLALLFSQYILKKNFFKVVIDGGVKMPDHAWEKFNLAWVAYFFVMGALNLYVAFSFSQSTWVSYKLYSIAAAPIFMILMSLIFAKYIEEQP